jgi:hypothetical protein
MLEVGTSAPTWEALLRLRRLAASAADTSIDQPGEQLVLVGDDVSRVKQDRLGQPPHRLALVLAIRAGSSRMPFSCLTRVIHLLTSLPTSLSLAVPRFLTASGDFFF